MPIYGILTQPYHSGKEDPDKYGLFKKEAEPLKGSFIMMSHVKYLQAAGARIVPVSYKLDADGFNSILGQLNGIYIPGDHPDILLNERYVAAVKQVLFWAQDHNSRQDQHFPVVAVSYGYIALMMQAVRNEGTVMPVSDDQEIFNSLELNLRIKPEESYVFDGLTLNETESWLNNATFYSDLVYNIQLDKFLRERDLSDSFVPVATFNHDHRRREQEFVAIVEGAHFPFFALAFSVERTQFNHHL